MYDIDVYLSGDDDDEDAMANLNNKVYFVKPNEPCSIAFSNSKIYSCEKNKVVCVCECWQLYDLIENPGYSSKLGQHVSH